MAECGGAVRVEAAGPQARHVIGEGSDYPADFSLREHFDLLVRSKRERRKAAWAAVAKVIEHVSVSYPLEGAPLIPRFRTWYDREDFRRIFQYAYAQIGPARRRERDALSDEEIDRALRWNVQAIESIPGWNEERIREFIEGLDHPAKVHGISGIRRSLMSPAAIRHLLRSYPDIWKCLNGERPPPHLPAPVRTSKW
ncbi:MAG: hypothetical protein N2515_07205, partial [Deltaproteobacteria bacterium]|nr:hypothetical protein [Deltaproteobacteria bacterium]